jgi:hypothetical protein
MYKYVMGWENRGSSHVGSFVYSQYIVEFCSKLSESSCCKKVDRIGL